MISVRPPKKARKRLAIAWGIFVGAVFIAGAVLMFREWTPYFNCVDPAMGPVERIYSSAYRSAQLFTLTAAAPPKVSDCSPSATSATSLSTGGLGWLLVVISIAAPLCTITGVIGLVGKGVGRLLLGARKLRGDMLIVCGTGQRGLALIREESASAQSKRTMLPVAVALDDEQGEELDRANAFLVVGDAEQEQTLSLAGAGRRFTRRSATAIVVATQDVRRSEEIAEVAAGLTRGGEQSWVAYNCVSRRATVSEVTAEPLGAAGPFPVDLSLRQARIACEKALSSRANRGTVRVSVIGDQDPLLAANVAIELTRPAQVEERVSNVTLVLPNPELGQASAFLERTGDHSWDPAEVDVRAATQGGEANQYAALVAEIEASDVTVIAPGNDELACDVIDLINRNKQLQTQKIVVCLTGENRGVSRLLDENQEALKSRTEKVLLNDVASVSSIKREIDDLRSVLAETFPEQSPLASGVELIYGAGVTTSSYIDLFASAAAKGVSDPEKGEPASSSEEAGSIGDRLAPLNWAIAALRGPTIWRAAALELTEHAGDEQDEEAAFLAWCEWLREIGSEDPGRQQELIVAALDERAIADQSGQESDNWPARAAQTARALLELAQAMLGTLRGGEPVAVLTGRADGVFELDSYLAAAIAKEFRIDQQELKHLQDKLPGPGQSQDGFLESTFGRSAEFRSAFTSIPPDHKKIAIASPDQAFRDFEAATFGTPPGDSQAKRDMTGPGNNPKGLQPLIQGWRDGLSGKDVDPARSSVICLYAEQDGKETGALPEVSLARALGFSRIAVTTDTEVVREWPTDLSEAASLPMDRMTLRAFLNLNSEDPTQRGPLSAGFGNGVGATQTEAEKERQTAWCQALQENYIRMNDWLDLQKPKDDLSMQSWGSLIGYFRDSTKATALDWPNKAASISSSLLATVSELAGSEAEVTPRDAKEGLRAEREKVEIRTEDLEALLVLELLAEMEHGRWNCERIMSGWRSGKRNVGRKLTDKAKPWDDENALNGFDDAYRDLDRQQVLCCLRLSKGEHGDS